MATRILDPDRFILAGSIVDWDIAAKKHGTTAAQIAAKRKVNTTVVQLRWMLDPKLGLPTQAFQVWQRPHASAAQAAQPVANVAQFPMMFGWTAYSWDSPLTFLQGTITPTAPVIVAAYAGAPYFSALVGVRTLQAGAQGFSFSGTNILSLVVMSNTAPVTNLRGLDPNSAANDPAWTPLEIVGLPVQPAQWAGVFNWSKDQGMNASPLPPVEAALDRYRRGAPFFGWDDPIEAGHPAPPWIDADPKAIVQTLQTDMLDDLRKMISTLPPRDHVTFRVAHDLALAGTSTHTAATSFSPISTLMLGISSDTLASLIAGFGTAYSHTKDVTGSASIVTSPFDFMVTAMFEKGLDGASATAEYAAIICAPGAAPLPPTPANLSAPLDGLGAPVAVDTRYQALARIMWDQIQQATPFRVAAYAAARYGITPAAGTVPLMGPRKFDPGKALQPISATTSQVVGDATGQLRASDETYALDPTAAPNTIRYAISHEDIFGQWSAWAATSTQPTEPKVAQVSLVTARLDTGAPPAPPGSVCDATLTLDLTWDWTVRRPKRLLLVGRLYAAAKPGLPPADLSIPAGMPSNFPGGPGAPFVLTFNGANAGTVPASATLAYISDDAKQVLAGPVAVAGPRRYRVTIPGFKLDFAANGHIGLAMWAQAQENLAPQRTGAWSAEPLVTSASDPRPPVITAQHEDVQLASLADARGEHRARLAWDVMAGAAGYFIYETTESKFRIAAGLGEPLASQTISDRLLALRDAFEATPLREPFTRLNSTAIPDTSMEVVIGRGSKEIHLYLVLGFSAGQIETAWPGLSDANRRKRFQAFAAPRVVPPSPPRLEVTRTQVDIGGGNKSFRAGVTLTTRPGASVARLDLYRVRVPEASLELDTMGPAVARISGSDAVWHANPSTGTGPGEAQALGVVTGNDNPGGSWKRVYYRAAAVADDDLTRAIYGGRSQPTGAAWVMVPPDGPPDVSAITADWPGMPLEAVRFTFTSPAPVPATDLGPHLLRVDSFAVAADGTRTPLFAWPPPPPGTSSGDSGLQAVPTTQAAAPALWAENAGGGVTRYRLLLTRPHLADAISVRVLLGDPLGRATERLLDSPGGSPLPAPDILNPLITPVPGNRFVLSFTTDALFTSTPLGPYRLTVSATVPPTLGNPHPPPINVNAGLPSIAPLVLGQDPFLDAAPIPLRRQRAHINVYLRASAKVVLTMASPDGHSSHLNIGVP